MADAAPTTTAPSSAPAGGTEGTPAQNAGGTSAQGGGNPSTTTQTAPDYKAQINELLKKAGLKVKAGGREHDVQDLDHLMRNASKGIPIHQSLQELEQTKAQLEPVARIIQQLKNSDPEQQQEILMRLLGKERFLGLSEKALRKQFAEEEELSKLSPRERDMQQRLRAQQEELKALQKMRQQQEQEHLSRQEQMQVQAYRNHIGENVSKALEILGLPADLNSTAVDAMKPVIRRMLENNIPLNPELLAEVVERQNQGQLMHRAKTLKGEALLKFFGPEIEKSFREAILEKMNAKKMSKKLQANEEQIQGAPGAKRNEQEKGKWKWSR